MEKNLNTESKFTLSLKEIVGGVVGLISIFGVYFTLTASVESNTEEIESIKDNSVQKIEFSFKDELIRSNLEKTQQQIDNIESDVNEIKEQLQKLDERLYDITK
tara:strand:+ start:2763 stop:3074 length:312 start_codon:yes stop_codon:yes gene_type:complete